ncbi:bifunctional DNA primase/polymerase [Mycobacteroides chelonae]|uniref:bifunctional DNA primase/polymerase n=1 Tax=Mycobacteroides chelonae TaxID=1774 RepID=UPI001C4680C5|nr:bifunctional DNA primase/polymerase [Mycobacteroides chelonae]MBV6362530.1 bifunctional DNA primase/polymerase [Mycobacteroides chelonae]
MSIAPDTAPVAADLTDDAVAYATAGYAVFPLKPGEKAPATANGFYSASSDPDTVRKMWAAAPAGAGIGLVPMLSGGLLVVDADTQDGADMMRAWFGEPTVLTAGHAAGKHQGGGHWWLWLDEGVTLPEGTTIASAKSHGLDLIGAGSGGAYVVAPPTTLRQYDGRAYQTVGDSHDVPSGHPFLTWLADVVQQQQREQEEKRAAAAARRASHAVSGYPNLAEWSQDVLWSDLLGDDGWTNTGDADRCGCPLWTHPWGASTPRSATAHESGCEASRSGESGVLHAWSTTVADRFDGQASITKYRYVATERYDGDYKAAREGEGIPSEDDFSTGGAAFDPSDIEVMAASARWPFGQAGGHTSGLGLSEEQVVADAAWTDAWIRGEFDAIVAPLVQVPEPQRWIYTAVEAAKAGYHTPRVVKEDGSVDKFDPWDRETFPMGHPAAPDLLKAIFDFNGFTRSVFYAARAFTPHPTGPVPLLVTEFIRAGMRWPTEIGPMPGTPLSTSTLRIGSSGKGKSLAMKRTKWSHLAGLDSVAEKVSGVPHNGTFGVSDNISWDSHRSTGSGEALPDMLCDEHEAPKENGKGTIRWKEQKAHAVAWVEEPEFRATLKRGGRDSSVLFDNFNALWAGENAMADTRTHGWTELTDFNVFLSGGMQPEVWLQLKEQITGFLQRTLLTGVSDPWRLTDDVLAGAPPYGWTPPQLPTPGANGHPDHFVLCPEIHEAVRRNAEAAAVEKTEADDDWESHLLQVRIRVACLAALRFGTMHVTADIWEWTAYIIEHHRRVRAWMLAMAETAKADEETKTGETRANIFAAEKAARRQRVEDVMDIILGHLAENGGESTRNRAKRATGRKSDAYVDAEAALVKAGKVELLPVQGMSVPLRLVT